MTTVTEPHRLWRNTRYLTWLVSDTSKGLAAALFSFAIPLLALIVTNDTDLVRELDADVLVLHGGHVIAQGHGAQLLWTPSTEGERHPLAS